MNVIERILTGEEFRDNPPILVDIGASGKLHKAWKRIAKYSICIAFDPDEREMSGINQSSGFFKKMYVYNRLVSDGNNPESDFYFTRSPFCSSALRPLKEKLKNWAFHGLFEVKEKVTLKTINLKTALSELNISRIDWFKTDSQGLDLRLFSCLGEAMTNKILAAEFEPGIIDAYESEDKLWNLLSYMDKRDFWATDMKIFGSQRIAADAAETIPGALGKNIRFLLKDSPGWAEISFLNSLHKDLDKRDYLLLWVFAYIKKQYGFAYEVALKGREKFKDDFFVYLQKNALSAIMFSYLKLPLYFMKKVFDRYL